MTMIIFSANYVLGKEKYTDVAQDLKGSFLPRNPKYYHVPSVRVGVYGDQVI